MSKQHSLELHVGGVPSQLTYGASIKTKFGKNSENYFLFGYTWVGQFFHEESRTSHGINLGYGHFFESSASDKRSHSIEIGGGPGYDFERSKFVPNGYIGYSLLFVGN